MSKNETWVNEAKPGDTVKTYSVVVVMAGGANVTISSTDKEFVENAESVIFPVANGTVVSVVRSESYSAVEHYEDYTGGPKDIRRKLDE